MATHAADLKNGFIYGTSLAPTGLRTSSANGTGIDCQNGNDQCAVIITIGTATDGTHTFTVEQSKNNNSADEGGAADAYGAVPNADTVAVTSANANSVIAQRFTRSKRFARSVVTVSGATTGASYSATVVSPKRLF